MYCASILGAWYLRRNTPKAMWQVRTDFNRVINQVIESSIKRSIKQGINIYNKGCDKTVARLIKVDSTSSAFGPIIEVQS